MNSRRRRSMRRACPYKAKLDIENAQSYLLAAQKNPAHYRDPENLELYQCECGWLHIGHKLGSKKQLV